MNHIIVARQIPNEVEVEDEQHTYHCPHCHYQGFLVVQGAQQVDLTNPALVQRHQPVELASTFEIRCVNPACPSHLA
jgi:hypothetical protein